MAGFGVGIILIEANRTKVIDGNSFDTKKLAANFVLAKVVRKIMEFIFFVKMMMFYETIPSFNALTVFDISFYALNTEILTLRNVKFPNGKNADVCFRMKHTQMVVDEPNVIENYTK